MENQITKMGAVNCSTMVLAAVVSLLATANRALVPNTHRAPRKTHRFSRSRWPLQARYSPITPAAMMVRPPLMDIPFQGIALMHSPPKAHSTAAKNTYSVPRREPDTDIPPQMKTPSVPNGNRGH